MDEQERIDLVMAYHRGAKIRLPREQLHAVIHVVVENQIADDGLPVRRTVQRCRKGWIVTKQFMRSAPFSPDT